jgi:hypothetical protein
MPLPCIGPGTAPAAPGRPAAALPHKTLDNKAHIASHNTQSTLQMKQFTHLCRALGVALGLVLLEVAPQAASPAAAAAAAVWRLSHHQQAQTLDPAPALAQLAASAAAAAAVVP